MQAKHRRRPHLDIIHSSPVTKGIKARSPQMLPMQQFSYMKLTHPHSCQPRTSSSRENEILSPCRISCKSSLIAWCFERFAVNRLAHWFHRLIRFQMSIRKVHFRDVARHWLGHDNRVLCTHPQCRCFQMSTVGLRRGRRSNLSETNNLPRS